MEVPANDDDDDDGGGGGDDANNGWSKTTAMKGSVGTMPPSPSSFTSTAHRSRPSANTLVTDNDDDDDDGNDDAVGGGSGGGTASLEHILHSGADGDPGTSCLSLNDHNCTSPQEVPINIDTRQLLSVPVLLLVAAWEREVTPEGAMAAR
jgi:hypothetical protein